MIEATSDVNEQQKDNAEQAISPKKVLERIKAAEKWVKSGPYKTDDARWKQWEKNQKYLLCVWTDSPTDGVNVNTIYSNNNTIRPTLYFKDPRMTAKPTKPRFKVERGTDEEGNQIERKVIGDDGKPIMVDNYTAARLISVKINHIIREIKFKKTTRKVISDNLCPYGIGWYKVGYTNLTVGSEAKEGDKQIQYWVKRVDPRNVVYDWMSTDIDEDCRFIAERLVMTRKKALKRNWNVPKSYKCVLPDFLKEKSDKAKKGASEDDLLIVWEYHDLESNYIRWILDDKSEEIIELESSEDPYPFEGSCYVPLVLNDNNDDIIGLSDVEPVEDQAKAINRIRTKQTRHIDMFGTRTDYEDGAILDSDIDNCMKNDHGLYLKWQAGGLNKSRVNPTPPMGNDNYQMDSIHKEDIRTTLGITDYQQGGAQSRTATEGNIIQNAANIRIEERRDIIYDAVIEVVRRLAAMVQHFCGEDEFMNIADENFDDEFVDVLKNEFGYNPKIPFLHLSKDRIQGEYDWEFQIDDMISRPKEVQLQQWTNLLSVIGSSEFLMKGIEEEDVSMGKVVRKVFELAGADIDEVKRGGPAQIPEEVENQMFLNGMEVPEPHRKDHHDSHILSHDRLVSELMQQAQMIQQQMQQIQMQAQAQVQQMVGMGGQIDPMQSQEIQMQSEQQTQQLSIALKEIEMKVRNIKLHQQMHDMYFQKKQIGAGSGVGMVGQMPKGQPAASQQVAMQQQAQQVQ